MLQRYDISLNGDANRLSIKEFAAIGRKLRKSEHYDHTQETYSLIHEVSYDGDIIRDAINKGQEALISELRSDDFFPIHSCAKIMAEEVTNLFNNNTESVSEMFFDDRTVLSANNEK
jgi:predicted signal transduction protein with EAL and GGDEF domain